MLNFKNISPSADFYSKLDLLERKLDILNKNVLYITHMQDKILKLLKSFIADDHTQKQVDDYFDETSHQTEIGEQPANKDLD